MNPGSILFAIYATLECKPTKKVVISGVRAKSSSASIFCACDQ